MDEREAWYSSAAYDPEHRERNMIGALAAGNMLILGDYGKTLAPTLGADHAPIDELPQQQYGTIISPWNMLPRRDDLELLIEKMQAIMAPGGLLIIEEADYTGEYVQILDQISPHEHQPHDRLRAILSGRFALNKMPLVTHYQFSGEQEFVSYFLNELRFHDHQEPTQEIERRLRALARHRVEERAIFYVCASVEERHK